jgi:GWxTD domain-containing protein
VRTLRLLSLAACLLGATAAAHAAPEPIGDNAVRAALTGAFDAILADSARADYLSLSGEERLAFRRRFWARNDPTPTTERNELLEEELERVRFALEECRRAGADLWDARGDIAIRFGIPPVRSKYMGDVIPGLGIDPPAETWSYPGIEMTISFIDPSLSGTYVLGTDEKRIVPGPRAIPLIKNPQDEPPEIPRDVEAEAAAARASDEEARGLHAALEVPLSYAYTPPALPIPLVYEVVTARGDGHSTDVAVNYQFPMSGLTFEGEPPDLKARSIKRIRVFSTDYRVLSEDGRSFAVDCKSRGVAGSELLVTDEWRIDMTPGNYVVAVSIEDPVTGRMGQGKSLVSVPPYPPAAFTMSDIVIGSGLADTRRFRRMGGSVVPHPVRAFPPKGEPLIYFEVYGLHEDRPGRSRFSVETEVSARNAVDHRNWLSRLFSRKRRSTSTLVTVPGEAPDTAYWYRLSVANLVPDIYDLKVRVTDLANGSWTERSASFTVTEE